MIATLGSLLLVLLLAMGMPVAFAMAVAGVAGLFAVGGLDLVMGMVKSSTISSVNSYELITIPMFILMAEFIIISRIADELFDATVVWVGRVPGGLGVAVVLAGAMFGAISGSSTASAATLSSTAIPAMMRQGYSLRTAGALVAITGTLAILIPPSIALVLYAIIADVSVGKLLIAGMVPGILAVLALVGLTVTMSLLRPKAVPAGRPYRWSEKVSVLRVTLPMLILFGAVTGVLYAGVATPTEASAMGAFAALLLGLVQRRLSLRNAGRALVNAARVSCMIAFIILGAHIFGYFFTLTQTTTAIANWVGALDVSSYVILLVILVIYLILGCFLDQIAILILTVPVMLPVVVALGFDPIWFGVMVVMVAEVGMITPPLGLNVFVVARYTGQPVHEIFAGILPFFLCMLGMVLLLGLMPEIVLWLPNQMSN
ncbi:TRAP transporter large permease [Vannielia sp.]|uniref:TRAP transporter large permease n=1 Tax=Vannielia sp. TaxID=2813045 RepID=UPI0026346F6A|nr:TRAP transporter large permease [Vannielia sp.]MDF1873949.1 TRAP transporter large permease [Vannielia sp.]